MSGTDKVVRTAATLLLLCMLTTMPAKAQLAGFGGGGGEDMMGQMAPMLEMMKAKMGKRRFATMMQTIGPMMAGGGGLGGLGGMTGGGMPSIGGGNIMGMIGGGEMMSMIPQLMSMANFGGGRRGRRHPHR